MRRNHRSPVLAIMFVFLLLAGCASPILSTPPSTPPSETPLEAIDSPAEGEGGPAQEEQAEAAEPKPVVPVEQRVTLMAVGDIMMHQEQLDAAWNPSTKQYDFAKFFYKIEHLFKQADLVVGNLETTLAGKELKYTGYPMFNSPESLASTLKQVGFSAVTTANNHSLDRKEKGVLSTIHHLDQAGLLHTGTFRSAEERNEPLLLAANGIKLGIVAYTYGTNGIPLPQGKPYLVNLIDPQLIKQDIARAREKGADLVAVALHFGAEYQRKPNESQYKTVDQVFSAGADLILGHHPHVVQPYEWREIVEADGQKRKGLVIYSLGNFVSAQRWDFKDVGAILKVVIKKTTPGTTVLEEAEVIPTYVVFSRQGGKRSYVVYPLAETLQAAKDQQDVGLSKATLKTMEQLYEDISVHVSSMEQSKQKQ